MSDRVLTFHFDHDVPERLDKYLVEQLPEFSRSRIQGLISDGHVDVNGLPARKAGQSLELDTNVTVRIPPTVSVDIVPEDIPLDIVFENDDLIVINKAAGMVVHPAAGHSSGTLVNAVLKAAAPGPLQPNDQLKSTVNVCQELRLLIELN